jgi:hypothetical protein
MVMKVLFFILTFAWSCLQAQGGTPVRVYADLDPDLFENAPIMGTISVEHSEKSVIDKSTFRLKNAPLAVEQIKQVKYSPTDPLTLTIFRFQLPPREKGLYPLDEISVSVDGRVYSSVSTSFEVKKKKPSLQQQQQGKTEGKSKITTPMFILEAFVEPNKTLYPGQRTKVGYRYYYNRSIDAKKEVLPLLEAEGFKKVGGKIARSAQDADLSLLEVAQEIEAIKPGEYTFGPSYFEGVLTDPNGDTPDLKGEAKIVTITVVELPQKAKPPSYKNAIGHYTFETKLDSTANVEVGEKMLLRVIIKGAPLDNVELPDLCCQPGMAGRFHFSDIPPPSTIKDKTIQFVVDIRPMDSEIKEIPVLEFSFFNPEKGLYERTYSQTIPIKVKAIIPEEEKEEVAEAWPKMNLTPQPITIAEWKPIPPTHFLSRALFQWWGLFTVPIAAGALYFQLALRNALRALQEQRKKLNSAQLLESLGTVPAEQLAATMKACLLQKLVEEGVIPEPIPYEELSNDGKEGKVKALLARVDAWNYSESGLSANNLASEVATMYRELEQ